MTLIWLKSSRARRRHDRAQSYAQGRITRMRSRMTRRVAFLALAVLALAQVNAAFASCPMGGGAAMSQMGASDTPCEGCDTMPPDAHDQIPSVCATQCAT